MVILISITNHYVGGNELSAFDQAVVLNESGHEVTIVTNLHYLRVRAKSLGIKTHWFPWLKKGSAKLETGLYFTFLPLAYCLALLVVIRAKPDLIDAHSPEDQLFFTQTKRFHKKPVVWRDAGDLRKLFSSSPVGAPQRHLRKALARVLPMANYIYFMSPDDEKYFVNNTSLAMTKASSVVPSGILFRYYDRNTPKQDRPWGKIIIGTLVRMDEYKGLQYLIKAARRLGDSDKIEFWLVGGGAYEAKLQKMAEDLPNVRFFPYTTAMDSYLNTFDILVHPTTSEGWGRIVSEAMFFGLPIIGSRVGGIKEQITDGEDGLLFKPGDVSALSAQLKKLVADKELRLNLGQAAKAKAERQGDFAEIVKSQILPIYERVLRG